jgi:hypothetical protein
MGIVVAIKGAHQPPRASQSRMETLIITPSMVNGWRIPPFQRPLRINCKVQAVTETIKKDETIEGVLTLGMLKSDQSLYVVDGQHRIEAFKLSGLGEAIADVRVCTFGSMADMAQEFVQLNQSLVKMRPDDILRGLEPTVPALKQIRNSCEFVGYGQLRRGSGSGPILSMSALLRCWSSSQYETPASSNNAVQGGVVGLAQSLDQTSIQNLIAFLATASSAWGRDPEFQRLWGNLNMTLCMWLWNKLVIDRDRSGTKRYILLDIPKFKKCLVALSAEPDYIDFLRGRTVSDRDRSPAYNRVKRAFTARLNEESHGKKVNLPQPAWSTALAGARRG